VTSLIVYALVLVVLRFGLGYSWLIAVLAALFASMLWRAWLAKRAG